MQTKWCSALKRAESTQVSCVTLMACLRSIHQSFSLSVCVCLQFDFVELLDGRRLLAQDIHGLEGPVAMQRSLVPITTRDTGFIQYMDSGIWHLAIYNDGKETETVSFLTTAIGECPGHDPLLKPVIAIHNPYNASQQHSIANSSNLGHESETLVDFNSQAKCRLIKVKLNITKIRTSVLSCHAPSRALRDHNILISLSVFQANQGSSFWDPFAYNSKYDCTLLLVPFLITICCNFHLLSIHQSGKDNSLLWHCNSAWHAPVFPTYVLLCGGDFVLYAPLCSP